MPGITGIFRTNGIINKPSPIIEMAKLMKYVETDFIDMWHNFNFDIARVHHGVINFEKQPIFNQNNSFMIFMDGEIYDYNNIKNELIGKGYRFRYKHSDPEFCLYLYEDIGEKAFTKLNGSFVIAIYNLVKDELIIANDRFASRPLYYFTTTERLIFASEMKALIVNDEVPRILDKRAVLEFFTFRRVLETRTYYEGIQALSPATIMTFRKGYYNINKYWEMNFREQRKPEKYYIDMLTTTFREAVKRRMSDKHQYGILLSGGLDSRAILAAAPSDHSIIAFTMGDWENREVKIARKIAEEKGVKFVFLKRWRNYAADLASRISEVGEGMYHFDTGSSIGFIDNIKQYGTEILFHGFGLDGKFQGTYLPKISLSVRGNKISFPLMSPLSKEKLRLSKDIMHKLWYVTDRNIIDRLFIKDFIDNWIEWIWDCGGDILYEATKHNQNSYNKWDYFVSQFISKHYTFIFELEIRNYIEERTIFLIMTY